MLLLPTFYLGATNAAIKINMDKEASDKFRAISCFFFAFVDGLCYHELVDSGCKICQNFIPLYDKKNLLSEIKLIVFLAFECLR